MYNFLLKYVKSKVAAKNDCNGRLIAKIFTTTFQVNWVPNMQKAIQITLSVIIKTHSSRSRGQERAKQIA